MPGRPTAANREPTDAIAVSEMNDAGSDASFRLLFSSNPVAMFLYDQDTLEILEANEAAAILYGYSPQEFVSLRISDLLAAEDRWRIRRENRLPHNGKLAKVGKRRHIKADGNPFDLELVRHDFMFMGRKAALVAAIDITEQSLAEKQLVEKADRLRRSQEHLARAQRLSHLGSDDRNLLTDEAEWSDETYRIFGVAKESFVPTTENFLKLVHPDDYPIISGTRAAMKAGVTPEPFEYRIVRPDGSIRIIYRENEVVYDDSGRPVRMIGTLRDVTDKRAMEARQRQHEEQLGTMAEKLRDQQEHLSIAQGIARVGSIDRDLVTNQMEWSDEARRIFGLEADATLPSQDEFLALFHPEDRPRFLHHAREAANGKGTEPIECRIMLADGTIRWLQNVSDTVFDEHGMPRRQIGTFQDVTERHEAQERQRDLERSLRKAKELAEIANRDVQAANLELEIRVELRTTELRAAQQELVTKERLSALGQLTATVAHELRNPLSAIRNTLFAVRETAALKGYGLDRPLDRIERSILRCEGIISELLEFTRARELSRTQIVLDEWISAVLDEQNIPAGIVLERRLDAAHTVVLLDGERFRRVLINLLENAAHALADQPSERRITVTTSAEDCIEIIVEDTGPGISPDILPKVFEPLFSTKSFGTGLGLPTVRQIVEQHGGTISIASAAGRGTALTISLPLDQASPADDRAALERATV